MDGQIWNKDANAEAISQRKRAVEKKEKFS